MASEAQIAADIGAAGSCASRLRGHELHAGGLVLAACVRARRVHACVRTCHAWAGGLACSRFLLWRFRSIWTVPATTACIADRTYALAWRAGGRLNDTHVCEGRPAALTPARLRAVGRMFGPFCVGRATVRRTTLACSVPDGAAHLGRALLGAIADARCRCGLAASEWPLARKALVSAVGSVAPLATERLLLRFVPVQRTKRFCRSRRSSSVVYAHSRNPTHKGRAAMLSHVWSGEPGCRTEQ